MDSDLNDNRYIYDYSNMDDKNNYNKVDTIDIGNGNYGISLEQYEDYELPTVSVLTVTYNRDFIFDIAIRNWSKFIYPKDKIEWIILDDSTNNSTIKSKLPDDLRIKYIRLDKTISNIGKKRNAGIELCSNSIICFMDDDDYYFPDSVMNRVKVLLKYKKDVVGSVSINCVNLIDNTSFITGGGIHTFKNGDKTIICAEATLCFYKTFWEIQKFNDVAKSEEVIDFIRNRIDSFIHLHGGYVMIAFSHGYNMSSRALVDSINIYNFLDELDVNTVNFIEDLRLKILMLNDNNKKALDFYKKIVSKGLGTPALYKKINNLPKEVQMSPVIKELRRQYPLFKVAPSRTVNILYYYLGHNTKIKKLDRTNPDVYTLEMYALARYISQRNYNVTMYMYTDDEFTLDNFKIRPHWKYSGADACDITIVYREITILTEKINTNKLYFFTSDNIVSNKNVSLYKKCDEIWVDRIDSKISINSKFDYPLNRIHVFKLLDLSVMNDKYSKNKEPNSIAIFINLSKVEMDAIKTKFNIIYAMNYNTNNFEDGVTYLDNLYSVNTEYILNDLKPMDLLYAKYKNSKLCLINYFSEPLEVNIDYCELPLNFLNYGKKNDILDRIFIYQSAGRK